MIENESFSLLILKLLLTWILLETNEPSICFRPIFDKIMETQCVEEMLQLSLLTPEMF